MLRLGPASQFRYIYRHLHFFSCCACHPQSAASNKMALKAGPRILLGIDYGTTFTGRTLSS
jgi:hypothetical protein